MLTTACAGHLGPGTTEGGWSRDESRGTTPEQDCPADAARTPVLERHEARDVPLGGLRGAVVSRTLPQRDLSTVGAWCFLDAFTPGEVPMNVLPHPHIGLQTVTWPLAGRMLHRDSLGSEQVLVPGELNLMTSGDGVAHSEFMVDGAGARGLQLWVALPDHARRTDAAFDHIADLPVLERSGHRVTVIIGEHDGATSPARVHSPLLGLQVDVDPGAEVALPCGPISNTPCR
ncbi:pirin family protein [Litorihabitans aurantiacus]|uniref:pirin family protein n=1 Tax=Litorihabitans aurantiacus TaxID=1930061 RepID=UPI0032AF33CB